MYTAPLVRSTVAVAAVRADHTGVRNSVTAGRCLAPLVCGLSASAALPSRSRTPTTNPPPSPPTVTPSDATDDKHIDEAAESTDAGGCATVGSEEPAGEGGELLATISVPDCVDCELTTPTGGRAAAGEGEGGTCDCTKETTCVDGPEI
jgi:hypothetical protein